MSKAPWDWQVRSYFDPISGKWWFSIVDVVGIIAPTSNPRNYWKVLKNRLKKGQNQLVTECNQLKMQSKDGKFYLTDAGTEETILKIVEVISKKHLPAFTSYFELWAVKVEVALPPRGITALVAGETYPHPVARVGQGPQSVSNVAPTGETFLLPIDSYFKDNNFIVKAFTAGTPLENISITIESNILKIKGKREMAHPYSLEIYFKQEILWGEFYREIDLPCKVEIEKVKARELDGILTIYLPISKIVRPKRKGIDSL